MTAPVEVVLAPTCPAEVRATWEAIGGWLAHTVALLTARAPGDRPVIRIEPAASTPRVATVIVTARGRMVAELIGKGGEVAHLLRELSARVGRKLDCSLVVHITDLDRDEVPRPVAGAGPAPDRP